MWQLWCWKAMGDAPLRRSPLATCPPQHLPVPRRVGAGGRAGSVATGASQNSSLGSIPRHVPAACGGNSAIAHGDLPEPEQGHDTMLCLICRRAAVPSP